MKPVKPRAVAKPLQEVVVAVTNGRLTRCVGALCLAIISAAAHAAVLPNEAAEIGYHSYSGDDVEVTGPTVLVRKNFKNQYAISASRHVDDISSASVDVITQASKYSDQRTEHRVGFSYLHTDSLIHLSASHSDENDYEATTLGMEFNQDVYGGLSTISLGFSRGWDTVSRSDNSAFEESIDRHQFQISLSQVLSPVWVASIKYELIGDDGYLKNPYRRAYINDVLVDAEVYPESRTSHAISLSNVYYLQRLQGTHKFTYRYFTDSWGVSAFDIGFSFAKPLKKLWVLEPRFRLYSQDAASFYRDNASTPLNFLARDKELSTFISFEFGLMASYNLHAYRGRHLNSLQSHISYDYIAFDYDDFSDPRDWSSFSFSANVLQLVLSATF